MNDHYDEDITDEDRQDMRDLALACSNIEFWLIFTFFAALFAINVIVILVAMTECTE